MRNELLDVHCCCVRSAVLIHFMMSDVSEWNLFRTLESEWDHTVRGYMQLAAFSPFHAGSHDHSVTTSNCLVHSNSRPVLSGPWSATQFQGTEEAGVHPRARYIGTDHRLWTKCNYTFLEPQSVSIIHLLALCFGQVTAETQYVDLFLFKFCFDRYTIELKHGDFSWTIKKRYKHIQHLHQQLKLFRASLNIPFPTRAHRERRSSFRMAHSGSKLKSKDKGALPRYILLTYQQTSELNDNLILNF
jgi:hypothetical protein